MTQTANPIRIGIIGCGQIAQRHLSAYSKIPDAHVVACADIDPVAADTSASAWGRVLGG